VTADKTTIGFQEAGILLLLSTGIFALDLLAPTGVTAWLLYLLPLALTVLLPHKRAPVYYSAVVSLFMFAAYTFNPPAGVLRSSDLLNRVIGLTAIWVLAFVTVRYGRRQARTEHEQIRRDRSIERGKEHEAEEGLAGRLRLESIVESAMDAIITIDESQSIVLFNQAAEVMFECRAEEALGGSLDRFIPARFRAAHRDHIVAFGKSGTTSRRMGALGQVRAVTAHGEEFPVEAAISQIAIDGKKYFTVILRDTRERERLKRELEEREALLRTIIEAEPECVKVVSLDGMIQSMNAAGLAMLEAEQSQDVIGKSVCDFVESEYRASFNDLLARAVQGHASLLEFEAVGLCGRRRWLESHAVALRSVRGGVSGILIVTRDVTARKQAETELKRSEERLQSILASMEEIVWSSSVDFSEILYVSPAADHVYGRSAADLIARPASWLELIHPEDRPAVEQEIRTIPRRGHFDMEYRVLHPGGGVRSLHHRGRLLVDDAGCPIRVDGIISDITKAKTTELALRKAQERFQDIFESSKDAIGYVSLDGAFVLANEAFATLTRYSREELLSKTHRDLTPPEFRALQAQEAARVLLTGEPAEYEKEYIRKDGSRVPVAVTLFVVKGDDGKPDGVAAIVRDITERKRAEQSLRQSEQRYRQLVEVSPDAIFINSADRIVFINQEGLELLGAISPDQVLGRSPFEFIHPDSHEQARDRVRQLMEGLDQVPLVEEKFVRVDGSIVDVEVTAARYMDQQGPAIQVVLRDITQRKRLQEQLRRTERVAELGTLASGMAHEIGTPMNVILGRAEYLMNRTSDEPVKKGLQTIVGQVERITRVMNQLLSFARRRTPERRAVDLREVVESSLEMFHERLARHGIIVEMDFEEGCPPVHADADQMSQVLINLLMNAIHALPDGGRVRVATRHVEPDMVQLILADTGSGMPADVMAKIFDPFFTTKEFGAGTGLGLTVVKGIMEEHGGCISVESEPGKGTTFKMVLPQTNSRQVDTP
jgi:PAS domain S-box-containing protein